MVPRRNPDEAAYGEPIADLMPGLMAFCDGASIDEDGMFQSSVRLEPAVGRPLIRALMRAEAELLLEDADALGTGVETARTPEQRAADAFERLVQAVCSPGS